MGLSAQHPLFGVGRCSRTPLIISNFLKEAKQKRKLLRTFRTPEFLSIPTMNTNTRSILTGVANLVAFLVVIGVVSQCLYQSDKPAAAVPLDSVAAEPLVDLPVSSGSKLMGADERDLRHKGKGKGKSASVDCIPLYEEPPTGKGKGKSSKGKSSKGKSDRRQLGSKSSSKGSSKGKGKSGSEAPVSAN